MIFKSISCVLRMAFTAIPSKIPMVIILGATGTGKTKLSIELAQKFGAEIISADSMQIYKGLDIVTSKATVQERQLVPHHLLDILDPLQIFTVVDFKSRALKIIDDISKRGKIPIIVGGTTYYIESIVYKILIEDSDDHENLIWHKNKRKRDFMDDVGVYQRKNIKADTAVKDTCTALHSAESNETEEISVTKENQSETNYSKEQIQQVCDNEKTLTNEEIHERLKAIDPDRASQLHPNQRRKVLRALEIWIKTGRRCSEILNEQKWSEGQLRRPDDTVILWLRCDQSVHDERLDTRVDCMVKDGLVDELLDFHKRYNKDRIEDSNSPDYTKGIFQALGLKEFHEYLMLPEDIRNSEDSAKLFSNSIELMKIRTRRYARYQNKFIRNRFLNHKTRETPAIFELDTTNLSEWESEVKDKAINILESFTLGKPCQYEPIKSNPKDSEVDIDKHSSNYCDICERLFIGDNIYKCHLSSHKHRKMMERKKRLASDKNVAVRELANS